MHTINLVMPFHPFIMAMMFSYPLYLLLRFAWRALPVIGG